MPIAAKIHDLFTDGWDFCDAVRESTPQGKTLESSARAYKREWGSLQDMYTIEDFRQLDARK
jgi:chemotaxis regulatin CheY-phosphate phosphatase CheZ